MGLLRTAVSPQDHQYPARLINAFPAPYLPLRHARSHVQPCAHLPLDARGTPVCTLDIQEDVPDRKNACVILRLVEAQGTGQTSGKALDIRYRC